MPGDLGTEAGGAVRHHDPFQGGEIAVDDRVMGFGFGQQGTEVRDAGIQQGGYVIEVIAIKSRDREVDGISALHDVTERSEPQAVKCDAAIPRDSPDLSFRVRADLLEGQRRIAQNGVANLGQPPVSYWTNPANRADRDFWAVHCKRAEARHVSADRLEAMYCPAIKAAGGY